MKATDADDPGTGSSRIEFHITAGNEDGVFAMETDDNGEGRLVVAKVTSYWKTPTEGQISIGDDKDGKLILDLWLY